MTKTMTFSDVDLIPETTTQNYLGTSEKKWKINGVDNPKLTDTDTKNTTGSTDTSSKIYLVGATSQDVAPQTYSDDEIYTTDGVLTTKSVQIGGTAATLQYNTTDECIDFIFE